MSSNETVQNNGQQATTNYDISKIFIWNNRTSKANYTNNDADAETLVAGTVLGRVGATGEVKKLDSNASDGSQFPCGVLMSEIEVGAGDTEEVVFCDDGDVVEDKLIFQGYDDLDTEVSDRIYRDHLKLMGIKVIPNEEQTDYDNQP